MTVCWFVVAISQNWQIQNEIRRQTFVENAKDVF